MSEGWLTGVLRGRNTAGATRPQVVKVGGSLLTRAGWARDLESLVAMLPGPRLLVVGGGPLVDGLRAIDHVEPQPAARIHRLAIDCLTVTARLVAATLGMPLLPDTGPERPPTAILDAPAWLDRDGRVDRLPIGWHVTSDSISALVATELEADLVLVKSVPPPHDGDLAHLAAAGWVDAFFPRASRPLSCIHWAAPAAP